MFPGKLAVIHTESYASGPSAVVPLSEIGQARPLQKHTAYVLREFRPSSCHLALSDVPHLTLPKSIVTCLSPHRLQYRAPPCLFYLLVCSCKLLTSCSTLVLTLSILLLLFLILLSHLRVVTAVLLVLYILFAQGQYQITLSVQWLQQSQHVLFIQQIS